MRVPYKTAFRVTDPHKHGISTAVASALITVVAIVIISSSIETFAPEI